MARVLSTNISDWYFLTDEALRYEESLDQRAFDTIVDMGKYIEQQRGPAKPTLRVEYVPADIAQYAPMPQGQRIEFPFDGFRKMALGEQENPTPFTPPAKPKPPGHSELTRELDID
jgi:hypothetical protein